MLVLRLTFRPTRSGVLNPKRADAEGSPSMADGSKRPHYSYLSPTSIYDTPLLSIAPKCSGQSRAENSFLLEFSLLGHLAFASLVRPKVGQEKAKSNGFSARFWAEFLRQMRLGFEGGEAKATGNRSFGDVPNQPSCGSGPDYFGR